MPIPIVSALGQVNDRIDGLEAGADDFVLAPCSPDELLARLAALLRRIPSGIGIRLRRTNQLNQFKSEANQFRVVRRAPRRNSESFVTISTRAA